MQSNQPVSGAVLRAARILAGMTQADLAAAANLHPKSVAYWERKGSKGKFAEVGARRIRDALRAHGVILVTGKGEGALRAAPDLQNATPEFGDKLTDEKRVT